jgi:hypothetical protein
MNPALRDDLHYRLQTRHIFGKKVRQSLRIHV